jgi:hypothetical protein
MNVNMERALLSDRYSSIHLFYFYFRQLLNRNFHKSRNHRGTFIWCKLLVPTFGFDADNI